MGALGRTPDYVNVTLAGFAGRPDLFGKNGDQRAAHMPRAPDPDLALCPRHGLHHPALHQPRRGQAAFAPRPRQKPRHR